MAEKSFIIKQPAIMPIKIVKWKVKEGATVSIGRIVMLYEFDASTKKEQFKFKSTKAGTIRRLCSKEGDIVSPDEPLFEVEACIHPTVMKDMCAECGADLRKDDIVTTASVPMVHSVPELKVNQEVAQKLGRADGERLLRDRKLVLLVDLDQTLIHTTNDNIPANLKDVYHFQLYGKNSPWYHTRLRPGTHKFLSNVAPFFELHICTFGARNYAHMIAMFLDEDGKFFSHRILSRDECFNATSKTANLKALFPCGDNMVCIIDDREDVWSHATNLIHVKPYHFFQHTGDINAPPGLDKQENDKQGGIDFNNIVNNTVKRENDAVEAEVLSNGNKEESIVEVQEPAIQETVKVVPVIPGSVPIKWTRSFKRKPKDRPENSEKVVVSTNEMEVAKSMVAEEQSKNPKKDVEDEKPIDVVEESRNSVKEIEDKKSVDVVEEHKNSKNEIKLEKSIDVVEGSKDSKKEIIEEKPMDIEEECKDSKKEIKDEKPIDVVAKSENSNKQIKDEKLMDVDEESKNSKKETKDEKSLDVVEKSRNSKKEIEDEKPMDVEDESKNSKKETKDEKSSDVVEKSRNSKKEIEDEKPMDVEEENKHSKKEIEDEKSMDVEDESKNSKKEVEDEKSKAMESKILEKKTDKGTTVSTENAAIKDENNEHESNKSQTVEEGTKEIQENNINEKKTDSVGNQSEQQDQKPKMIEETPPKRNGEDIKETKTEVSNLNAERTDEPRLSAEQPQHPKEDDVIEIEDPDDYLLYLEDILKEIHKNFYDLYDKMESGEVPDLKKVIPSVRNKVLLGTKLVFSGLVPTHVKLEQSKAYQVARSLGAEVCQDLEEGSTHLVAVRPGTAKVNAGRRKKNLHIVTPDWLWACAECWLQVEERLFPLNAKGSKNRHPPPHCSSPELLLAPNAALGETSGGAKEAPGGRKRTASGRFMDTINPLMSFSSADIEDMDREVEDIFNESDESESEAPQEVGGAQQILSQLSKMSSENSEADESSSSSSVESLTAELPRGFKRTRTKSAEDDGQASCSRSFAEQDLLGTENNSLDECPSAKFRRGEKLESDLDFEQDSNTDGSMDPEDEVDDGDWNMMGAALEREFLANN